MQIYQASMGIPFPIGNQGGLISPLASMAMEFCQVNNITVDELQSDARGRQIAHPRQDFMALARDAGFSLQYIADYLGGRDHTTILYGARASKDRAKEKAL